MSGVGSAYWVYLSLSFSLKTPKYEHHPIFLSKIDTRVAIERRWGIGGYGSSSHKVKYHANKAELRQSDVENAMGAPNDGDDDSDGSLAPTAEAGKAQKYAKFNADRAKSHELQAHIARMKNISSEKLARLSPEEKEARNHELLRLGVKLRDHQFRMGKEHGGRLGQVKKSVGHSWSTARSRKAKAKDDGSMEGTSKR